MKDKIEKIVLDTYDGEISEEEKKRQIEKMMQIYNSIVAAVDGKLSEEKILELLEQLGAGTQGVPIIKIFSDPNEFEASTRRKSDVYAHSWAGKTAEKTETWVLLGDYEPGIDDVYNYSDNGNMLPTEETHEMSDFSIDQIQAAITVETNFSNYNGDERDEYEEIIQLYLPGELDVSKGNKFKQIVLQQRAQQLFDSIKATVGVRLTDEQIHSIVRQYDFENMDIPEIVVSTDFHIFEETTRKQENSFEHSWAGRKTVNKIPNVLLGDYIPGLDGFYEYSDNGNMQEPEEIHEASDFSVNQVQVVALEEEKYSDYNEDYESEIARTLQIYLPPDIEYTDVVSFKEIIQNEKTQAYFDAIKRVVGERLSDEQIRVIIGQLDINEPIPEIMAFSDPYQFEKRARAQKDVYCQGISYQTVEQTEAYTLMGDFVGGVDTKRYQLEIYNSPQSAGSPSEEKSEISDFLINQPQVTLLKSSITEGHTLGEAPEQRRRETGKAIIIYIPEEREFDGEVSFKKIVETTPKTLLETKVETLNALREEARKLDEIETLIGKIEERGTDRREDNVDIGE